MCYTIVTQNYFLWGGGDCRLVKIYRLLEDRAAVLDRHMSLKFSDPANEIHSFKDTCVSHS